ncbi:hypothetical protein FB45DRAFT_1062482 [Roridomyces roridus]|uniref:Uncharacterized protein n=1 Tax=Roridomyces roridus TaxID=1738132 RepID=A0AAD7BFV7_9AGAR|nr:hypothetical protein FB45DRAFT_1062482 [Roridomyces roridus]
MQLTQSFTASVLLWSLSALIPNNTLRLLGLAAAAAPSIIYAVNLRRPSVRLALFNAAVSRATELLTRAKSSCPRAHFILITAERRLLQAELEASKVQTRLLKPHLEDPEVVQQQSSSEPEAKDAPTNKWFAYINALRELCGSLDKLEREVRAVETDILLAIEAERQRKLQESINDKLDIAGIVPMTLGDRGSAYSVRISQTV